MHLYEAGIDRKNYNRTVFLRFIIYSNCQFCTAALYAPKNLSPPFSHSGEAGIRGKRKSAQLEGQNAFEIKMAIKSDRDDLTAIPGKRFALRQSGDHGHK